MRTKRSTKSVLAALLLSCLVLLGLSGTVAAHNGMYCGWPDEPEDPDFMMCGGGGQRPGERLNENHQTQSEESKVRSNSVVLILWIRETLKFVWIP